MTPHRAPSCGYSNTGQRPARREHPLGREDALQGVESLMTCALPSATPQPPASGRAATRFRASKGSLEPCVRQLVGTNPSEYGSSAAELGQLCQTGSFGVHADRSDSLRTPNEHLLELKIVDVLPKPLSGCMAPEFVRARAMSETVDRRAVVRACAQSCHPSNGFVGSEPAWQLYRWVRLDLLRPDRSAPQDRAWWCLDLPGRPALLFSRRCHTIR
jgi:hypothetical protein